MILWRKIVIIRFYHFDSDPRFPHFYYVLGGNLGSLLYGDVFVMKCIHTKKANVLKRFLSKMKRNITPNMRI